MAEVPTILKATQYLDAGHRDAARVASELAVIALLEGVLWIGREIKDPQIVDVASAQLEKLRGSE